MRATTIVRDTKGATAIEFGLVALPFLMMCLGILQFLFLHYNQDSLSDALFAIASQPTVFVTGGDTQAAYKTAICNKSAFQANCTAKLKVERYRLATLPTAQTAVAGTVWQGASGDLVVLRASLDTLQVVGFVPTLTAKDSVIYALP